MKSSKLLWEQTASFDEVDKIAAKIAEDLPKQKFCLWLKGDLGVGKTFFSEKLLHKLGLSKEVPVLSPTFTLLTEYQIGAKIIAHLDLYRLVENDADSVQAIFGDRDYFGSIVEWAERCESSQLIEPSHELRISFCGDDQRTYQYYKY